MAPKSSTTKDPNAMADPSITDGGTPAENPNGQPVYNPEGSPPAPAPEETPTPETPERPEWLPEKFQTPEEMARSYQELEAKMRGGEHKPEEAPAPETPETTEGARETVEKAGLDFDALGKEYDEYGRLSDATYADMEKAGIPRNVVDNYIAGQEAVADSIRSGVFEIAGGEDGYNRIAEWAGNNLTDGELEAFNDTIENGSPESVKMAVRGLKSQYDAKFGQDPNLVGAGADPADPSDSFGSYQEMTAAMKDPRYKSGDPVFHAEVKRKLANSQLF